MKKLFLTLLTISGLAAQTASFPGAIADTHQLKVAGNNLVTKLTKSVSAGDTVFVLANVLGIVPDMLLTVDTEAVSVVSVSGNLVTVTRGFDSTTPVAHAAQKTVSANVTAWHHNKVAAEIIALENALGSNLTNLPRGNAVASPADYNFTPRTPAQALVAATTNVITISCPIGVSGTDLLHQLLFSGGGAADSIETITGGNCVSGASSGTLIFTSSVSRTPGYTVSSSTSGIDEAGRALGTNGGTVSMQALTYTLRGTVGVGRNLVFAGAGDSTVVVPPGCSGTAFSLIPQPQPAGTGYPIANNAAMGFRAFMLDGHACNGLNSQIGVGLFAGLDTTTYSLVWGIDFEHMTFNNVGQGLHLERARDVTLHHTRAYANTRFVWTDTQAGFDADNHTFEVTIDDFVHRSGCKLSSDCGPVNLSSAIIQLDTVEIGNLRQIYMEEQGLQFISGSMGIQVRGFSEGFLLDHIGISNTAIGIDIAGQMIRGVMRYPGFIQLNNCGLDVPTQNAIRIEDGTGPGDFQQAHNIQITATSVSNMLPPASLPGVGYIYMYVGQYTKNISFVQAEVSSLLTNQIGIFIAPFVNGLSITNSLFEVPPSYVTYGLSTNAVGIQVSPGVTDFSITGNQFTGITKGIVDQTGANPTKTISGNTPLYLIPSAIPQWQHINVLAVANGTYGCLASQGCFFSSEIGVGPRARVGSTVSVPVRVPVAGTQLFVNTVRVATATPCTGTATLTATLGTQGNPTFFMAAPYSLKNALGAFNFAPLTGTLDATGSGFNIDIVTLNITATGTTLDTVAVGCSVDVWILSASLPI